jgi:hypothetical protein
MGFGFLKKLFFFFLSSSSAGFVNASPHIKHNISSLCICKDTLGEGFGRKILVGAKEKSLGP